MSDTEWITAALERALDSVAARTELEGYPHVTENGRWVLSDDGFWTGGFWIGLLWAGYEERRDERFRAAAERLLETFAGRATEARNHDLGMMFTPSAVKGFELTGEPRYRDAALVAADTLASQFNDRGSFLPGWGFFGEEGWEGASLIDTLMNLRLLFWATEETGEDRFRTVALAHARTSLAHHLRQDGSTYHLYRFDPETGEPLHGDTYQGKSPDSCWSRGLGWLIAGCGEIAADGGGDAFVEAAERGVEYYLANLPADAIPYWDFSADTSEPRDASAGAIAAYGLVLLGKEREATRCLHALAERAQAPAGHPAILLHATADLPHGIGIDESTIYGDYYFVRALQELRDRLTVASDAGVLQAD